MTGCPHNEGKLGHGDRSRQKEDDVRSHGERAA